MQNMYCVVKSQFVFILMPRCMSQKCVVRFKSFGDLIKKGFHNESIMVKDVEFIFANLCKTGGSLSKLFSNRNYF